MMKLGKGILRTFTTIAYQNPEQFRPTGAQLQEFNRAIRYVSSIINIYLMT